MSTGRRRAQRALGCVDLLRSSAIAAKSSLSQLCDISACSRMPPTQVVFYQEKENDAPIIEWLIKLRKCDPRAFAKCRAAVARLALLGHELRRPESDYLRNGIHELRIRLGSINYRLLYFYHARSTAVLVRGLTKESRVPSVDLDRAVRSQAAYITNPDAHSFKGEIENA